MARITTTLYGNLALVPHQARAPVTESYEFLTDLQDSVNGTEIQVPLRNSPRRVINYDIPQQALNDPDTFNTVYGAIRSKWAIPMWAEGQYIGTIPVGTLSIACDTIYHDLRLNSLCMVWVNSSTYQILEITAITTSSISFGTYTIAMSGAYLIPLRVGSLNGDVKRPTMGYGASFTMSFQIEDLLTTTPAAPTQFLGNDLYLEPPIMLDGKLNTSFHKQYDEIDFDLGPTARRTKWTYTRYATVCSAIADSDVQRKAFKDFLFRRVGKYRKFWSPTFEHNLRIKSVGNITTTIQVHRDSIELYATQRLHFALKHKDGTWYPLTINTLTVPDATTVQFAFNGPALNINAADIVTASWLGLYRQDTDRAELTWLGNQVFSANVRVLELTP
jgi:hypothetical protein